MENSEFEFNYNENKNNKNKKLTPGSQQEVQPKVSEDLSSLEESEWCEIENLDSVEEVKYLSESSEESKFNSEDILDYLYLHRAVDENKKSHLHNSMETVIKKEKEVDYQKILKQKLSNVPKSKKKIIYSINTL